MQARDIKVGKEYAIVRYRRSRYHLNRAVRGVAEEELSDGHWRVKLSTPVIITPSGSWRVSDGGGPLSCYNETCSDVIDVYAYNFVSLWEKHLLERQKTKLKEEEAARLDGLEKEESVRIQKELPEVLLEIGCASLAEDQETKVFETWARKRKSQRVICVLLPVDDASTLLYKLQAGTEKISSEVTPRASALNSLLQKD